MPGVQMPHCAPPHSRNASCTALQLRAAGNAFDGANVRAVGLERGDEATVDDRPVQQHRARAALAFAAAFFRAGQMHLLAQHIQQARHRITLARGAARR